MKVICYCFVLFVAQISYSQEVMPAFNKILINFPNVRDFTISAAQDEAYFTGQSTLGEVSVIFIIKKVKNGWSEPEIIPFSGKNMDLEPFLSPDGLKLYFASDRPRIDSAETKDFDIWVVKRNSLKAPWSEPVNIGSPVNSNQNEFYPSVSQSGNLYFTSDRPGSTGSDDIFMSHWEEGIYTEPLPLSDSINSGGYEFNAFIAPDESYLLFTGYNREDGYGSGDLYISYKHGLNWSTAQNLGVAINSDHMDYCPFYQRSTKTLYYTSRRSKIKGGFNTLEGFLNEVNGYENGLSRIYQVEGFELPKDTP